jgi:hypothetical protein
MIDDPTAESHRDPGFDGGSQGVVVAGAMPHLEKDVVNDVLGIRILQAEPPSAPEESTRVPIVKNR